MIREGRFYGGLAHLIFALSLLISPRTLVGNSDEPSFVYADAGQMRLCEEVG